MPRSRGPADGYPNPPEEPRGSNRYVIRDDPPEDKVQASREEDEDE